MNQPALIDVAPAAAPDARDCWRTRREYIEAARGALGGRIELDPCSSAEANQTVRADRWIGPPADGLRAEWRAASLWMNPPFSRGQRPRWMDKLAAALRTGDVGAAVWLLPDPSTLSSQPLLDAARLQCIPRGRVQFDRPGGGAADGADFPTYLFAGGKLLDVARAGYALADVGKVWREF